MFCSFQSINFAFLWFILGLSISTLLDVLVNGIVFFSSFSGCSLQVCRNTDDLCLYLISSCAFISSNFFQWIPQDFPYTRSCHLQIQFYFFLSNLDVFCFFFSPDCPDQILQYNAEEQREMAILVLFLTLGEKNIVFHY